MPQNEVFHPNWDGARNQAGLARPPSCNIAKVSLREQSREADLQEDSIVPRQPGENTLSDDIGLRMRMRGEERWISSQHKQLGDLFDRILACVDGGGPRMALGESRGRSLRKALRKVQPDLLGLGDFAGASAPRWACHALHEWHRPRGSRKPLKLMKTNT